MNSKRILEHMCRACMCKNQMCYSLCDEAKGTPLTIYEMFATTIPQVPIHNNDELPKKICVACLNILNIVHKFQQTCIASDTYMRSLLVSHRLASHNSTTKQQVYINHIAMEQGAEKLDIRPVKQDLLISPRSIKVETNEVVNQSVILDPAGECRDNDAFDSEWSEGDDIPLRKSGNLKLNPLVKEEFQICMKYEVNDVEVQEYDLKAILATESLENKTVSLQFKDGHEDNDITTEFDADNDRLNKAPKISAERGREFRARRALLKQQSKQQKEPDAIVEIATEDIRSAGPSEDNQVPGPFETRTLEKRARCAEATRRWREKKKGVSESSKKQVKTAAQRMREYRERKKLAKKMLLKQQSDQELDAIVSTSSSQVNQRAGQSTINSISAELTRRGNSQSQQQIETSERTREYRKRRNDNINIESCTASEQFLVFNSACEEETKSKISKKVPQQPKFASETAQIAHQYKKPAVICPQCNKSFQNNKLLRAHMRRHLGERKFQCAECPKGFASKFECTRHMKIHQDIRENSCDVCSSIFTHADSLMKHKLKHTSERPYKCNRCDQTFSTIYILKRHEFKHTGERPFKCDRCEKTFACTYNMKAHQRKVHTND